MSCLGAYELNVIRRKIIEKLYMFSPRLLSYEKLRLAVDNPLLESFDAAINYLIQENIVKLIQEGYVLTDEGKAVYEDQGKFNEYFPLTDIPRMSFG